MSKDGIIYMPNGQSKQLVPDEVEQTIMITAKIALNRKDEQGKPLAPHVEYSFKPSANCGPNDAITHLTAAINDANRVIAARETQLLQENRMLAEKRGMKLQSVH